MIEHYTVEDLERLAAGSSQLRHWAVSQLATKSHEADLQKRNFDPGVGPNGTDRDKIDSDNFAGPHRSFPITSPGDVSDAASLVGHADNPGKVKAKIKNLARKKGQAYVDDLPDSWKSGKKQAKKVAKALEAQVLADPELTKQWLTSAE